MSDIPDGSSFALGLLNNSSQNSGPAAMASQANTNANTQVQQQSAQAQQMQNQILQARLPAIIAGIHDETAGRGDQSGVGGSDSAQRSSAGPQTPGQDIADQDKSAVPPDQNFYQPALIDAAYRKEFMVPQLTQQEQAAFNKARTVDPGDQYGMGPKQVLQARDLRLAKDTQQSQLAAQDEFDKMHAVTDSPDGNAMDVLEASHPDTVAAIRRQFAKDPDAAMDEDAAARMFASHAAGAVHQYTGRKAVKGDDGVYRDEATGISIPGVEKVGLSTEQYLKFAHEGMASVDMPDGSGGTVQVPLWQKARMQGASNINSVGDWVMARASQAGLPGASSTLSPNSAPKQEARTVAQAAVDKATKQRAAAPAPVNGSPPSAANGGTVARNAQGNIDPKLTDALNDKDFDYTPSNNGVPWKPKIGSTPPPPVMEDMQKQTAARNQLKQDQNQGVGAAQAALTMYKAAQDVLAKGNYNGGAWNAELAKYSKWLPAGWQDHMTGDYRRYRSISVPRHCRRVRVSSRR